MPSTTSAGTAAAGMHPSGRYLPQALDYDLTFGPSEKVVAAAGPGTLLRGGEPPTAPRP